MEKIAAEELESAQQFPVMFPESGHHSVPFSYAFHVRYRPSELKCEERTTSARTGEFKKRLLALWWLNGEQSVPYVFRIADGSARSMDAGCLGMLYLKSKPDLIFRLDASGHIREVSPTPEMVKAWTEHRELLLKQIVVDHV